MVNNKRRCFLSKGVVSLHDNTRANSGAVTAEIIRQLKFELIPHPPYYSKMFPWSYHALRTARKIPTWKKI